MTIQVIIFVNEAISEADLMLNEACIFPAIYFFLLLSN